MIEIARPNILLDALEIGVIILDSDFNIKYWNQWLEINTALSGDETMGKNLKDFYPNIDYNVLGRKIRTALRLGSPAFYDASIQNRFIEIPRIKITSSLLKYMQLQVIVSAYDVEQSLVMISIYDISDLHELKLDLSNQMNKISVLNSELKRDKDIIDSNLFIVKVDVRCSILEASSAFLRFFSLEKEAVVGEKLPNVFLDTQCDFSIKKLYQAVLDGQKFSGEVRIFVKDKEVWFDILLSPYIDEFGLGLYTIIFSDITDKKRIELLSVTDALTKLYNRYKFNEEFDNMMSRTHWVDGENSFALIISDIDHFKSVNDNFGHQNGDIVLFEAATVFSKTIRLGDVVARWGGEEFVFLLPNVNKDKALLVAEKLRVELENLSIPIVGRVTSSFGVSLYIKGDTQETIMQRADEALYKAKENGRNRVEFL